MSRIVSDDEQRNIDAVLFSSVVEDFYRLNASFPIDNRHFPRSPPSAFTLHRLHYLIVELIRVIAGLFRSSPLSDPTDEWVRAWEISGAISEFLQLSNSGCNFEISVTSEFCAISRTRKLAWGLFRLVVAKNRQSYPPSRKTASSFFANPSFFLRARRMDVKLGGVIIASAESA